MKLIMSRIIIVVQCNIFLIHVQRSVMDLGFPRGYWCQLQSGCTNLLFDESFGENCMKMKEIEPGTRSCCPPLGSANVQIRKNSAEPVARTQC